MQKALYADERIGKIAENPRNAAFLRSIEDRHSDDEDEVMWESAENLATDSGGDSESQSQTRDHRVQEGGQHQREQGGHDESIPDSQPTNINTNMGRKRSRMAGNRHHDASRAPSSLTEVRRSLSTLLDEPNASVASIIPATEVGSGSEDEGEGEEDREQRPVVGNKENVTTGGRFAVVDRIALKRNASSSSSKGHLAFAAPAGGSGAGAGGFKVPALLRRATTNSLISNSSASSAGSSVSVPGSGGSSAQIAPSGARGVGVGMAGAGSGGDAADSMKLRKTAGRGSGVNYFARENERRAAVAEAERRREKRKWKGVEGQKKAVSGLFGAGQFE